MMKKHVFFIIPAFNEERVIGKVIESLLQRGYKQIIVVNDGSSDRTAEIVKNYPVTLLNHIINRGQGAALHTGILAASSDSECEYIVTFDADGQHQLADVEGMLQVLTSSDYDVVLGSRFLGKENQTLPLQRKIMLKTATLFLRFIYGLNITDAHNGLRVFRKAIGLQMCPTIDNMVHASEIVYLIKKHRLRYIEYPVEILYSDYSLQKGQRTSYFIKLGVSTIFHKLALLFFDEK
ncbi:glycosyl transferase [Candidatus Moduliflexus flocculans]|uniref:Glycosyl transferase n=1 Tax=Candidatus Moduliflexus flocculans TaxID=1499966 RepID=A0A081BQS8_9BACT|nr:glycosyl transferase [Candidatus Moduliflexus flocculans]